MKKRLLDLFCCGGGAGMGYSQAGFEVVGVDLDPQPHYPFEFHRADALVVLEDRDFIASFDAIHASPPCQAFTAARFLQGNSHPELIVPVRDKLRGLGIPYVIENVVGAPLLDPIMLCGAMFEKRLYRHRLFESNVALWAPSHPPHIHPQVKMGRPPKPHEYIQVVGHFSGADLAREVMETPWMNKREMAEAIPPYYTEFIGRQVLAAMEMAA